MKSTWISAVLAASGLACHGGRVVVANEAGIDAILVDAPHVADATPSSDATDSRDAATTPDATSLDAPAPDATPRDAARDACTADAPCVTACGSPGVIDCAAEPACRGPAETCDGVDEDCDGAIDDGLPIAGMDLDLGERASDVAVAGGPTDFAYVRTEGELHRELLLRRVGLDGRAGAPVAVAMEWYGPHSPVVCAVGSDYLVAWAQLDATHATSSLSAARVRADGAVVDRQVFASGGARFRRSGLACGPRGVWIAWEQGDRLSGIAVIVGARLGADGRFGAPVELARSPVGAHAPSLAWTPRGLALAWSDSRHGAAGEIYLALLDDAGRETAPPLRVSDDAERSHAPAVAATSRRVLVAWNHGEARSMGAALRAAPAFRTFTLDGAPERPVSFALRRDVDAADPAVVARGDAFDLAFHSVAGGAQLWYASVRGDDALVGPYVAMRPPGVTSDHPTPFATSGSTLLALLRVNDPGPDTSRVYARMFPGGAGCGAP